MTEPTNQSPESADARPRRRRATRTDVLINHAALEVTSPANQQIGPWQQRAAWLCALAERRQGQGRRDPKIAREAADLLEAVEERQQQLLHSVDALPEEIAGSSRVDDTAKALDSVALVLRRTIDLAGSPDAR